MAVKYKSSSNYALTSLNRKYLDIYVPPLTKQTLSVETRKTIIPSKFDLRPDLMAYELFGNSNAWWILIHYNRDVIKDPIFDFKSGLEIVVPKRFVAPGN